MKMTHFIPNDCVVEILLRLPIKSLLKYRSVSKSWYALLMKNNYFINKHMKLIEKKNNGLLFFKCPSEEKDDPVMYANLDHQSIRISKLDLEKIIQYEYYDIVGSCNGIVCAYDCLDKDSFVLCNPATRETKTVPVDFMSDRNLSYDIQGMVFGYDHLTEDYKVFMLLSIFQDDDSSTAFYKAGIYGLKRDEWRVLDKVEDSILSKISLLGDHNLFFTRGIHWNAGSETVSLDISNEVFYEIQYPETVVSWVKENHYHCVNLLIIRGSIALICFTMTYNMSVDAESHAINIWLMKELRERDYSWSKEYTLGPIAMPLISRPLSTWMKNEEGEEDELLIQIAADNVEDNKYLYAGCKLVRWNLLNNEKVREYYVEDFFTLRGLYFYKESLVSMA